MNVNVLIDFSKFTDDELATEAEHIGVKMTGNTNFPNTVPAVTEVDTAKDEFVLALAACKDGGRSATLVKNQKRVVLIGLLRALGLYVQANCNNDLNIALSSGFKTKKEKESFGVLPKVQHVRVEPGPFPGSLRVSVDAVKGAIIYIYEWALTPVTEQTAWQYELGKSSMIIKNLVQGREYAIRVAAKGSVEGKVFSDVVIHYAA
jgi:hypothetical protein